MASVGVDVPSPTVTRGARVDWYSVGPFPSHRPWGGLHEVRSHMRGYLEGSGVEI